jgi:serine/threonine protein kinase/tetratricopeptide (TPR) repeat protein
MKPEHWQQLDKLFHSALERGPEECAAFLDEACAGDASLRKQVEALLAAHEQAGSFIESPAMEVAARGVAADQVSAEKELATAETVSHYRIITLLGAGGMGQVFLAHDTALGRQVALKLLPAEFTRNTDRVRRFQQEARAASSLNHPNIITIHEIGQAEHRHFIATEYIDGLTLRQYLGEPQSRIGTDGKQTGLQLSETLSISLQVADALAAAHAKGIVHRDIKPENIMLVKDSRLMQKASFVKVLDFGIAKLTELQTTGREGEATTKVLLNTHEGSVIGTASYMSPEQARGESVDARTDVWSLGVVLYEMLTNGMPFGGNTTQDVIASILKEKAPSISIDVPDRLRWIVEKALRKDREERYQTIREMFSDLRDIRGKEGVREEEGGPSVLPGPDPGTGGVPAQPFNKEAGGTLTAAPARPTRSSAEYIADAVGQHKRTAVLLLVTLLLAMTGSVYFFYFAKSGQAAINSVAVLPFTNPGNDPSMEYVSDGISGSLINSLSQLPQLKVIAQSSTFKYKGKEIDPPEVANALGVQAIVTGRIVRLGDNLQISVELINARNKTQMWGEQYNRKAADLQAVQGEIARTIVEKLRVKLTGAQEQQVTKHATENPEAYRLFLNGEFYGKKGRFGDERKALDYYNQAIALDPNFALAYVGVAEEYEDFAVSSLPNTKDSLVKAKAAVQRALELDESVAWAHAMLGIIKGEEWEWAGAEVEFKRAIELNPNLARAHGKYASYLTLMGRPTEALVQIKRAQELDPLSINFRFGEGAALYNAHRFDEAITQLQHVTEMQPDFSFAHYYLGVSYAMKGMYAEAIVEYQKFSSLEEPTTSLQAYLGYTYAMSGQRDKALAILKTLKTTKDYVSPAELAILYTGLGDKDGAFQELERAYAVHDLQMKYLKVEPHYDSLRSDPRFKDLMRRVGLPQ